VSGATTRFGRRSGRYFPVKYEQARIDRDMELHQDVYGSVVFWFFYLEQQSTFDEIYDEGAVAGGKAYQTPPLRLPVIEAVPAQGQGSRDDQGFSTYDTVRLRVSYEQARRAGFDPDLVGQREDRLQDRFVYRDRAFEVTDIQTSGHFDPQSTDMVFSVEGRQLRPDELVDSPAFASVYGGISGPSDDV
jgi:hypothetical protein